MNDDYQGAAHERGSPHRNGLHNENMINQPLIGNQQRYNDYAGVPRNGNNDLDILQMSQNQLQMSAERQQEIKLKKKADSYMGEIAYNLMIVLVSSIFVMMNKNAQCDISAKSWITVAMASYLTDFIAIMFQYHKLKVTRKENLPLMGVRFLILVFLTSWLIYGNVLYFNRGKPQDCDNGLRLCMFLLLLIGYFEMMKCFCISLLICILVPLLVFSYRNAARPNWVPAAPQFIQNLMEVHFNPNQDKAQDDCPICYLKFEEKANIILLPCDEKHYFHSECIKEWLKRNNSCPLCKKEITKEALKEQKKALKRNRKNEKNKKPEQQQQQQREDNS